MSDQESFDADQIRHYTFSLSEDQRRAPPSR